MGEEIGGYAVFVTCRVNGVGGRVRGVRLSRFRARLGSCSGSGVMRWGRRAERVFPRGSDFRGAFGEYRTHFRLRCLGQISELGEESWKKKGGRL